MTHCPAKSHEITPLLLMAVLHPSSGILVCVDKAQPVGSILRFGQLYTIKIYRIFVLRP